MRIGKLFIVVVLMAWMRVAAQGAGNEKDERARLVALENAWNQAQIHRDGEALNRLVTDNFVYTDTDGTVMNKLRFIADIKDPSTVTNSLANDDVSVFLYPGMAIVIGRYHVKGTNQGKPYDHYGRFTDTWISSNGQWMCAASHTNAIKKPAQ
ncbi:MAG TPA: nuclear transport factor 2 family protein [Terriglobales bacterium]|nr:nuclear transport factor 2 family protein [Terriglobales bacterium]